MFATLQLRLSHIRFCPRTISSFTNLRQIYRINEAGYRKMEIEVEMEFSKWIIYTFHRFDLFGLLNISSAMGIESPINKMADKPCIMNNERTHGCWGLLHVPDRIEIVSHFIGQFSFDIGKVDRARSYATREISIECYRAFNPMLPTAPSPVTTIHCQFPF